MSTPAGRTAITAANIQDGFGNPLAAGFLQIIPTDANDVPLTAVSGQPGGGAILVSSESPAQQPITNGALPANVTIADSNSTAPLLLCYRLVITDTQGNSLFTWRTVQTPPNSAALNLDTLAPNVPAQAVVQLGPQGIQGPQGNNGSSGFSGLQITPASGSSDYHAVAADDVIVYAGTGNVFVPAPGDAVGRQRVVVNATTTSLAIGYGGPVIHIPALNTAYFFLAASGWLVNRNPQELQNIQQSGVQLDASCRIAFINLASGGTLLLPQTNSLGLDSIAIYNYGNSSVSLLGALVGNVVSTLLPGCTATYLAKGGGEWVLINTTQPTFFVTTSGTSGPATLTGNTLNIPQYTQPTLANDVPTVTPYDSYGDSFTTATGATQTSAGYVQILAEFWRGAHRQLGFGGDESCDMAAKVFANVALAPETLPATTIMIGHNDVAFVGATAAGLANYKAAVRAAVAHCALPAICKVYGQAATLSGFAAASALPGNLSAMAAMGTANGSTVTLQITTTAANQALYVAWYGRNGDGGTATVTLDGTVVDTLATAGPGGGVSTVNGGTTAVFAQRYSVPNAGTHTLVLTITSATASGNSFTLVWAGTPVPSVMTAAPEHVYVLDPAYQANLNNQSITDAYIAQLSGVCADASADAMPIRYLKTNNYLANSLGMATANTVSPAGEFIPASTVPGLHPNDYGHRELATMVMMNAKPRTDPGPAVLRNLRLISQGSGTLSVNHGDQIVFVAGYSTVQLPNVDAEEESHWLYNFGSAAVTVTGQRGPYTLAPGTAGFFVNGGSGFYRFV